MMALNSLIQYTAGLHYLKKKDEYEDINRIYKPGINRSNVVYGEPGPLVTNEEQLTQSI